ncbi:MAG: flavin reductase family protein [Anaerolineales bacterium]|jgi:flavin reductase (DIM6/NTAB) family NADH-FMN oxidoreductase RutF
MEITPKDLPWQLIYKILIGSVVPRPIGWISSLDPDGRPNLAPFSFFNVVCPNPPHVLFNPMIRSTDRGTKDTLRNVRDTGEFVVNIVTEDLASAMNQTSQELPQDVSEFAVANLITAPSVVVKPPRVAASPVHFECRVAQIVDISDQPGGGSVVIGRVVHLHVSEDVLFDGDKIDLEKLKPIGRLAGAAYCRVTDIFQMMRPPSQIGL